MPIKRIHQTHPSHTSITHIHQTHKTYLINPNNMRYNRNQSTRKRGSCFLWLVKTHCFNEIGKFYCLPINSSLPLWILFFCFSICFLRRLSVKMSIWKFYCFQIDRLYRFNRWSWYEVLIGFCLSEFWWRVWWFGLSGEWVVCLFVVCNVVACNVWCASKYFANVKSIECCLCRSGGKDLLPLLTLYQKNLDQNVNQICYCSFPLIVNSGSWNSLWSFGLGMGRKCGVKK